MRFAYVAYDAAGRESRGSLDAPDERAARDSLAKQALFVTALRPGGPGDPEPLTGPESGPSPGAIGGEATRRTGRLARQVPEFARQLSILIATGTPLADGINALARQARDDEWREVVRSLGAAVAEGSSFSDAMAKHPRAFDTVGVAVVAAGEATGRLDTMLSRYAKITRQQQTISKAATSALIYPAVLSSISLAVILVMLLVVVPRFEGMFGALGADLPATTMLLLDASDLLRARWYIALPAVALPIAAGLLWARTVRGRRALDAATVRLPLVGGIFRSLLTARLARLLAVLLDAGIPLLEALSLCRRAMDNAEYRVLLDRVIADVTAGESLTNEFGRSPLIEPAFAQAVASAERSARLGEVLTGLSEHMDEDNHAAVKNLTSLIEPAILLAMGIVVATVVVSMFLPIFDLTAAAGTAR